MVNKLIWIIDDEVELSESCAEALQGLGYSTKIFSTGSSAHEAITKPDVMPSLVITDIKMPGLDGVTLIEKLRFAKIDVPVIIVSGYAERENLLRASNLEVAGFLEKPYEFSNLQSKVENVFQAQNLKDIKEQLLLSMKEQSNILLEMMALNAERYQFSENLLAQAKLSVMDLQSQEAIEKFFKTNLKAERFRYTLVELQERIEVLSKKLQIVFNKTQTTIQF